MDGVYNGGTFVSVLCGMLQQMRLLEPELGRRENYGAGEKELAHGFHGM